jgi:hypothetical protein
MRAQVDGVGTGCGYLVAAFLPGAGGLVAGPGAAAGGALVKRRSFYAVPGRWVLTWGRWPADQGGTMAAGIAAGIPSASEWPRGCNCMRGLDKNLSAATCSQAAIKPRFPGFIDSNPFVPVYCAA